MNTVGEVWRYTFNDDSIGGALLTGTVLYNWIELRYEDQEPTQQFLEQGLETHSIMKFVVSNASLDIRERDEIRIIRPYNHKLAGKFLRVVGVTESNFHPNDRRGYLILNVTRSKEAHVR